MRLVADASALVGEVLRRMGRQLITSPQLQLVATATVWSETTYEVERRVAAMLGRGRLTGEQATILLRESLAILGTEVTIVEFERFEAEMPEALRRMPRDPSDAPTVALALALGCGIWAADSDFCGCGVAVWSSDVLRAHLASA